MKKRQTTNHGRPNVIVMNMCNDNSSLGALAETPEVDVSSTIETLQRNS